MKPLNLTDENLFNEVEQSVTDLRDSYIHAPVGTFPNIRNLMREAGLLDDAGKATGEIALDDVLNEMGAGQWREARADYLANQSDLIPEEATLAEFLSQLELFKSLDEEIRIYSILLRRYRITGKAMSLDGTRELPFVPRSQELAKLIFAHKNVGDTLNNMIDRGVLGQTSTLNDGLSKSQREYLAKLGKMTPTEVREEILRFDRLFEETYKYTITP